MHANPWFPPFPGLPSILWHSPVSLTEDGWRKGKERRGGRRGKGRGWMCCSVLLNVLTCMKEEAFYFRTLAWVYTDLKHTHTHTHAGEVRAHKPRDRPDLPLYQSCFESYWRDAFPRSSKTFPYTWILPMHYTLATTHTYTHTQKTQENQSK